MKVLNIFKRPSSYGECPIDTSPKCIIDWFTLSMKTPSYLPFVFPEELELAKSDMLLIFGEDILSKIYMNEQSWKYVMGPILVDATPFTITQWTKALAIAICKVSAQLIEEHTEVLCPEKGLAFFYADGTISIRGTQLFVML